MWKKFVDLVVLHFGFLETDFDFKLKSIKQPFVTYESGKLQIDVFYDVDRNRELDLGVRRLGDDPRRPLSVGIGMLMRLRDGANSGGYESPYPAKEENLTREVKRLAELLRKYGSPLLQGDLRDFGRIEQLEKELAKQYAVRSKDSSG